MNDVFIISRSHRKHEGKSTGDSEYIIPAPIKPAITAQKSFFILQSAFLFSSGQNPALHKKIL
jgi:hypothetical protein